MPTRERTALRYCLPSLPSGRCTALLVLVGNLAGGCATGQLRSGADVPGGSVTDFDRESGDYIPGASTPAGAPDTIGPPDWRQGDDAPVGPVVEDHAPPPAAPGALLAGPPAAGRQISDPDIVRALQASLASQGYYHGAPTGEADAALRDALRRYQADQHLPPSGTLDGESARRLGVPMPRPLPPRQG